MKSLHAHVFDRMRRGLAGAAMVLAAMSATQAMAATISVGPFVANATDPFIVPVVITGAVNLQSFSFDVAYDPNSFQINTLCDAFSGDAFCDVSTGPITLGTFYTDAATFPPLFVPGFVFTDLSGNQIGSLQGVNGAWQDDPASAPSGDGTLAFIEFISVPGGSLTSPITVINASPSDPGTGTGTVPEPPLWALIGVGLYLAGRRRRGAIV
jgi:MYXO-CTERM domain-containing protein